MKYRIREIKYSNLDSEWTLYIPEYKHWYNLCWQKWSDPLYGTIDSYKSYNEAEERINFEKNKRTKNTKTINITYI